jgi:LCP family protein required for cell wall assembly
MAQTSNSSSSSSRSGRVRPGLDMVTAQKQANQFPTVGMTLRSYQYDPRDRNNRAGSTLVIKRSRWQRLRGKFTLRRTALILALLAVIIGGWVGGKFIYNAHKLFGGNIISILKSTKLKGEDQGRVNILLAGNSADDVGHEGGQLTDSIMLLSIDTKNNKAFMLSIPRDLWVDVPDGGHAKINSAYVVGEQNDFRDSGLPNGGMGELEKVIEDNLGVDINYYALVNYNALREAVDAVGGVDYTVKSSDRRGLYDPNVDYKTHKPLVKLTNGVHHLDGEQALDLARARGDAYNSYGFPASDFDRTQHQRELLIALKSKAVSAGVITNPAKLTSLSDAVGNNVKTDFSISEVHRLYDIIKQINSGNIQSLSLNNANGKNLLASYSAPGGQSALAPAAGLDDFSDIQTFVRKHMSGSAVVQEGATVAVLNATDLNGLASKKKTFLESKNLDITDVGDAKNKLASTTIIDNSGGKKPATRALLVTLFGNNVTVANPYKNTYDADFIVMLGSDQARSQAKTTQ